VSIGSCDSFLGLVLSDEVWRVDRYTSAAPFFFKSLDGYVDGGLVANNPSNQGFSRIKMFLREKREKQKAKYER